MVKKVLVANRGEIAVRIIRACQELGLQTVAIHSVADRESLHTKIADESVCVGPAASARSYLYMPSIMSAAEISGVDAIHPGYGFLAENAEFAEICEKSGICFIGPTPQQMHSLGNKIKARQLAIKADVPLLPGSEGVIKETKAVKLANEIGFPVIIKAAAGGGGRGMKIARNKEELKRLLPLAQKEALAGFGNADCFLEKYLEHPRHIEVQIIADAEGKIRHLGERDCSIQRRHQKLVEESPCPVLDRTLREKVGDLAVRLVKTNGYRSLGTVEFLFQDEQFYFMEMNVRAQVEHPVTEMVTGIDLIKEQIRIAQGHSLNLPETITPNGHAIECRINAEDPQSFTPWPGKVSAFHQPGGPGVRVDSMLYTGYTVPSQYDSLVAKLVTHGADRAESIARMRRALREMKIEGIRSNIDFHLKLMENVHFQKGNVSTRFLESF
ncbi:MAG: acetyl-CoA carboxylase biotin carboxylase subunit [Deltaproteobacteria bacterium]|nr:acetyl-CoA carboxylase biotin carboxylase subunit [Deltaproteobacteria bacterium]